MTNEFDDLVDAERTRRAARAGPAGSALAMRDLSMLTTSELSTTARLVHAQADRGGALRDPLRWLADAMSTEVARRRLEQR